MIYVDFEYEWYTQAEKPVLVEFSAPWCVYCRRLAPALEIVAKEYYEEEYQKMAETGFVYCWRCADWSRLLLLRGMRLRRLPADISSFGDNGLYGFYRLAAVRRIREGVRR